jgi:hypothetical protein
MEIDVRLEQVCRVAKADVQSRCRVESEAEAGVTLGKNLETILYSTFFVQQSKSNSTRSRQVFFYNLQVHDKHSTNSVALSGNKRLELFGAQGTTVQFAGGTAITPSQG